MERMIKIKDLNKINPLYIKICRTLKPMSFDPNYLFKKFKITFILFKILSFFPRLSPKLQFSFVYELNQKIVGFLIVTNLEPTKKSWYVYLVGIDKNYRRKGIGKKLFIHAFDFLKKKFGAKRLFLMVDIENKPAINLYRKLGFKKLITEHYMVLKL